MVCKCPFNWWIQNRSRRKHEANDAKTHEAERTVTEELKAPKPCSVRTETDLTGEVRNNSNGSNVFMFLRTTVASSVKITQHFILTGPFLDEKHPVVSSGGVTRSFQRLYRQQVEPLLYKIETYCRLLLLIPSVRDVHHKPIFLQPSFPSPLFTSSTKRNVFSLLDPGNLSQQFSALLSE